MLGILRKTVMDRCCACPILSRRVPENPAIRNISVGFVFSSSTIRNNSTEAEKQSFKISYLMNSCGLSSDGALIASKYVKFETADNPDKVVLFFKGYGFNQKQIATIVRGVPAVLSSNPEKTLAPKFHFFQSKGLDTCSIMNIITYCPCILSRSVENCLIPSFNSLSSLIGCQTKALAALGRFPSILVKDLEKNKVMNLFRRTGVPQCYIARLLCYWPRMFCTRIDRIEMIVEQSLEFGFNPSKSEFVEAILCLTSMNQSTWDKKLGLYKKWDLSEEEILLGFRKKPITMSRSVEMITGFMDLFVNKLGWEPSLVMSNTVLLCYSLEKRLIPRASVLQFLVSKGLLKKGPTYKTIFMYTEDQFLARYVTQYDEAPEIMKVYQRALCSTTKRGPAAM
ncbi:hypothetical protein LINPERPRIM_LOCUS1224 [Linum perenne]